MQNLLFLAVISYRRIPKRKGIDAVAQRFQDILDRYTQGILDIYGTHLKSVILYGSYARGDNREDSDVDIMILVDLTEEAEQKEQGEELQVYV